MISMKPELKHQDEQTAATEDYGRSTEAGTVRLERKLPGPIERVWDYLTDSEKRGKWFASGPMEQRAGGKLEFHFHNSQLTPHAEPPPERYKKHEGLTSSGKVTRCDPPNLLSFTWEEMSGGESEVTFELSEKNNEVLMVVTHRRLRNRGELIGVSAGWHVHVGLLSDILNRRELRSFWSTYERLQAEYDKRLPTERAD
jgi:uncharacterized protein YndB with AHSA1/START domain